MKNTTEMINKFDKNRMTQTNNAELNEFEKFKKRVLQATLTFGEENVFWGGWLEDGEGIIDPKNHAEMIGENFIQVLKMMAEKQATRLFSCLIMGYETEFGMQPLKDLLNHQDADFINTCGPCLLFSAIQMENFNFCNFLINDKMVPLHWKMSHEKMTALMCAEDNYHSIIRRAGNPKENIELVKLLVDKKADVRGSRCGENLLNILMRFGPDVARSLLIQGLSPFTYCSYYDKKSSQQKSDIQGNALSLSIVRARGHERILNISSSIRCEVENHFEVILLLCEFGAGLMLPEARLLCDIHMREAYKNKDKFDRDYKDETEVLRTLSKITQDSFNRFRGKIVLKEEVLQALNQEDHFINQFRNAKIVFRTMEKEQSRWIFDLKKFEEYLHAKIENPEEEPPVEPSSDLTFQTRIYNICKNLLEASDKIVAKDVKKVAEDALLKTRNKFNLTLFELNNKFFPEPVSKLVLSYSSNSIESKLLEKFGRK